MPGSATGKPCHAMVDDGTRSLFPGHPMNRLAAALPILLLIPAAALASQPGNVVVQRWKLMDKCTQQAQAAFPDFTPDANAKRDAKLRECLAGQNLPPREPPTTPR